MVDKINVFCWIGEVYVKLMLSYHGGQLCGNSVNDKTQLAKAVSIS